MFCYFWSKLLVVFIVAAFYYHMGHNGVMHTYLSRFMILICVVKLHII